MPFYIHMKKLWQLDWIMNVAIFLLLALGFLALYSTSFDGASFISMNFRKQMISCAIGVALMLGLAFYDYRTIGVFSTKLYFGLVAVLILVIFFGRTVRGTTGWIGISSFNIQPVEIAKLVMIIFVARFLSKKKTELSSATRVISSLALVSIPILLILQQPDFGSAAVIGAVWVAMLLASEINKKNIAAIIIIGAVASVSGWSLLKNYQKERIVNFIKPENDPQGSGYNVIQSIVAVGSGKIMGKGLGHGSQSQLNFLPEKHTDFIFAVISEELGFLGAGAVFVLFGILFFRMKEIARTSRDNFGYLVSVGIIIMVAFQMLVNIGMNIGVMPVAGVPLPYLSYGGSSLVAILAASGILQSIYLRRIKT
ncbi:MAG: Peptidoglycan glycosyltransferase RodA [Patescibacteria group bacterium]|nr:Peptidoglycan glycosyltransferase RodA [Patescibacteria group bacterium]